MTPLEMIAEWRKSCSCAPKSAPEKCPACTRGLIDALEGALRSTPEAQAVAALRQLIDIRTGHPTDEMVDKWLAHSNTEYDRTGYGLLELKCLFLALIDSLIKEGRE